MMKTRKTIKWIASILGASILVSTAAFTVVSCSSSEPASNKYSPEEQKIINYRTEFKDKFYQFIVEKSNEKYGSFTTECNDVLKKASVSVYKNLNDEMMIFLKTIWFNSNVRRKIYCYFIYW